MKPDRTVHGSGAAMNLQHHIDRAQAVAFEAHTISQERDGDNLADQVMLLADTLADALIDIADLTPVEPTVLRRGCWLHDAPSLWFLLVEQIDFSEQWWAVRFDRYGCASTGLKDIHVADYQRCEAPDWWTA